MKRRLLYASSALLAAVLLAVFVRSYYAAPTPPTIDPADMEPAVAAIINAARDEIVKHPRSAKAWGRLGQVLLANEYEDEALPCCVEAERLAPRDPRWPYYQGGILLNRGDREAAVLALERALGRCNEEDEAYPPVRCLLAETMLRLGRFEDAATHFRAALVPSPDDARALFDMGLLSVARQNWQMSLDYFLKCQGRKECSQKVSVQLALVYQRLGDDPKAARYRELAERLPKDAEWPDPLVNEYLQWAEKKRSRHRLAQNLESAGRFSEAASVLQTLAERYPDDYLPFLMLGRVLGQLGDATGGKRSLRRAVQLAPDKVQSHYYLSLVLIRQGEQIVQQDNNNSEKAKTLFEEAATSARQALERMPDYGYAHMALAVALKHLQRREQALASMRAAVRCNPEYSDLHYLLGEMVMEEDKKEAREHLEEALRMAPHDSRARVLLDRLKADP